MGLAVRPLTAISCLDAIWHCQYHIIWIPKYGYRVLVWPIKAAACTGIQAICGYAGCEIMQLNVQRDHVKIKQFFFVKEAT